LAGGVPDLQFDCAAVQVDCPDFEVYSDGWQETDLVEAIPFTKYVVGEAQQEAGLTY
jgi:hypothetical protein